MGPRGGDPAPGPAAPTSGDFVKFVLTSDNDLDDVRDLFAISAEGRRLNLAHSLDAHVSTFDVAPDDVFVAFGADDGVEPGLYATPVNEASPLRLSPAGRWLVHEIAWSPGGSKIAYRAEFDGGPAALYVVGGDGTGHIELSADVAADIRWTPDGARVLFRSDKAVDGQLELYSILCDGTGEARLSFTAAPPGTARFVRYSVAPAGGRVAFRQDQDVEGVFELHAADVTGLAPAVRVSNEPGTEGSILPEDWRWSPDGAQLVYRRRVAATGLAALFLVNADGAGAREVSGAMNKSVSQYAWSPDGSYVAFRDGDSLHTTDGAAATELAAAANVVDFAVSPSGARVAYAAGDSLLATDLFVVNAAGGTSTLLARDARAMAWRPQGTLAGAATPPEKLSFGAFDGGFVGSAVITSTAPIVTVRPTPRDSRAVVFTGRASPVAEVFKGTSTMSYLLASGDLERSRRWAAAAIDRAIEEIGNGPELRGGMSWGGAAASRVQLQSATGVTFNADLDAFVDPTLGVVHVVAVDPARLGPGSENFYRGSIPVPIDLSQPLLNIAISGVGFPAQGVLNMTPLFPDVTSGPPQVLFDGTLDFGDSNGVFDFCTSIYFAGTVNGRITITDAPFGLLPEITEHDVELVTVIARKPLTHWIKVLFPSPEGPVFGWVPADQLELPPGALDKVPIEL